jgi:hypothetical protein
MRIHRDLPMGSLNPQVGQIRRRDRLKDRKFPITPFTCRYRTQISLPE